MNVEYMYQILQNVAKPLLREVFTVLTTYIRKEERFQIGHLNFYIKKVGKKNKLGQKQAEGRKWYKNQKWKEQ